MERVSAPETSPPPAAGERLNLLYTVAIDPAGTGGLRQMVKMLAGSVARTFFTGDMVLVRDSPQPVFVVPRAGIAQCCVETPVLEDGDPTDFARAFKAEARHCLPETGDYEWVIFLDADCLCLRNIDHLLREREGVDILYQPEPGTSRAEERFNGYLTAEEFAMLPAASPPIDETTSESPPASRRRIAPGGWGVNSGTWAVRGSLYPAVMEEWARLQAVEPLRPTKHREQSAWNRLILDAAKLGWRAGAFEPHEIQFPLHLDRDWRRYRDAAIVHCTGGTNAEKIEFMFGLYLQRFFYDPACTLLEVVEM